MEIVQFKQQPEFRVIKYDGSNLKLIKEEFKADIRESHMGTPGLFIDNNQACQIVVGDVVTQEIGAENNIGVYSAELYSEIFKTK
jgi:hypothetical protein